MEKQWWRDQPAERYWLEATDRPDIGGDLRAPLVDASGRDNWRYTLFRESRPGDIVFHYDGRTSAIVGWSEVAGPAKLQPIVWAARGSYARERGAVPTETPGYEVPLQAFTPLDPPISLAQLRQSKPDLHQLVAAYEAVGNRPLYFPFELSGSRDLRPMQGYAFKLPAGFLSLFSQLSDVEERESLEAETNPQYVRNPPWSRDELILALDLYMSNPTSPPNHGSLEVAELSEVLNRMGRVLGIHAGGDFRNANGVYMKMMNFRRFDTRFTDSGMKGLTRGNRLEEGIWAEFAGDTDRLHSVASSIRAAIEIGGEDLSAENDQPDLEEAVEGRILTRIHRSRERNRKLVDSKKKRALSVSGRLACEACDFEFEATYGERGKGFIEAHHTKPVHTLQPNTMTRLEDLALLCANCHRMIHARRPWLTVDELKALRMPSA